MVRMVHERRTREGCSRREIIRSLKRCVACELYCLPRPYPLDDR